MVVCKTRADTVSRNDPGGVGDGGGAASGNNYMPCGVQLGGGIRPSGIEPAIYGLLDRRPGR